MPSSKTNDSPTPAPRALTKKELQASLAKKLAAMDPSRPGAVAAPGEGAPRPADRQDQAQQVDAAVGRLNDAQVDAVAAEVCVRDGADAPMKRTLLLTCNAGQVLDVMTPAIDTDQFAPRGAEAEIADARGHGDVAE